MNIGRIGYKYNIKKCDVFMEKNDKKTAKLLSHVNSFSKIITVFWLFAWLETLLFSQFATLFEFGDATSIQYMHENVRDIGVIICGFYFSTKCAENIAQGYEEWRTNMTQCDPEDYCE